MRNYVNIACLLILLHAACDSFGQVPAPGNTDASREFEIIRGPSMRTLRPDSTTTLQTIAGGAVIKQGTTIFTSDSAVINPTTHIVEAFGHVHINQADSVQTYADYLKYLGIEKIAYLKGNVTLTDKKGTLLTQDLDYNLGSGIGNYHSGGKVIDRGNTITSQEGTYYSDTKDVYFRNNVDVIGPKNRIKADSLIYNMESEVVAFTGNTTIKNNEVNINTTQGTYDLKTSNAFFTSRTAVKDSSNRYYVANNMALDDKSGNAQLEGNAIIRDSANGFIVTGNQIFLDKKNNSFLATRKPVMIIIQKNDSTYISADTLFSGITSLLDKQPEIIRKVLAKDSLEIPIDIDSSALPLANDSLQNEPPVLQQDSTTFILNKKDSAIFLKDDSFHKPIVNLQNRVINIDSTTEAVAISKPRITDTARMAGSPLPSPPDSLLTNDVLIKDSLALKDSTIRYFLGFHHVKIYNDSLQSICDSLFFSARDSVFRLFYDPVVWAGKNQVNGDTIFLYTRNQKPARMYVFEKGMIVNKTPEGFFNQIAGKTINGYFIDGKIDYMRVRGSQAESVYYAMDDDSSYVGMNRASGDVIDLYFQKDDLIKVLFVNDVAGKMYPMKEIPADARNLKNFLWLDEKRPKNKLELFE
ncbi:MAG: OstA-like protein [Ginsengibacter sp.]